MHPRDGASLADGKRRHTGKAMAKLICRLPLEQPPTATEARAAGIAAWLVPAVLDGDGVLQLAASHCWLEASSEGLPFCLEWQLPERLTPKQEWGAAGQLAQWLQHPQQLRWRGHTPLWIAEPERLSQLELAAARLHLQLGPSAVLWGAGPLAQQLDGWYEQPQRDLACQVVDGYRQNYESFLFHAHHRCLSDAPSVVVPAVLPLSPEQDAGYLHGSAALYREWLELAMAWADLWHRPGEEAWVLVESWHGHQRWWQPPAPPNVAPLSAAETPGNEPTPKLGWGEAATSHPAVLVHGYHLDLLRDLLVALGPGEQPALDLYLSTPTKQLEAAAALVRELGWKRVELVGVPNRGRDVAPFVCELLPRALANGHPWLLKLHTKRSQHLEDGRHWSGHLLGQLGSPSTCAMLERWFAEQPQLGLVAAAGTLLPNGISLHHNARHLAALADQLGWSTRWLLQQPFVAGSMFAVRAQALAPLLELKLPLGAFEPEQQQRDGTLAHALERLMAALVIEQALEARELPGSSESVPQFGYGWAGPPLS